jgi:UDP-N-acetylmuramate dehydrogenase
MLILENQDLTAYNTFHVQASSRYFARVTSAEELKQALVRAQDLRVPVLCLGGGSNILFTNPFNGLVIRNEIRGQSILQSTPETVRVKVGAGENWDEFVQSSIHRGWGGLENLSLIPGSVGAAPIQNIGAYGVEVSSSVVGVEVLDRVTLQIETLSHRQCQFGYRESIFKKTGGERWIITAVVFDLSKQHKLNTSYGLIELELEAMNVNQPTIRHVADAVIKIRKAKLPDPNMLGNAGSFFKNPVISEAHFESLRRIHPGMIAYRFGEGMYKVAAGWLIEACGLKGYKTEPCGIHQEQALVLVNYGGATGRQILSLAEYVRSEVLQKFNILLEVEVNII